MNNSSYSDRLHKVIPGGAHTYSRGDDQFPSNAPQILSKGKGAYIWDAEGRKFLDYGMALRAVTIGYANERINNAAIQQIGNGVNLPRPSLIELEAAETITSLFEGAEMVKFAKNGSNVTTAALKIARAYTGRKYICVPRQQPFFSFDDWFIGTTPLKRGIPDEHHSTSLVFDYNDIGSLELLFDKYPDQIAAVMLEPATTIVPCAAQCSRHTSSEKCKDCPDNESNFLHQVKRLAHKNNALFILDEMITGFRWDEFGAQTYYNVVPDMSTFGKGMANGFSVAALVGKKEFMNLGNINQAGHERTFLMSTTHGAEMPGMGAFVEAVKFYREHGVIRKNLSYGEKLFNGINNISKSLNLYDHFRMDGGYAVMNFMAYDNSGNASLPFRTLFVQEMIKQNVFMPWVSICFEHGEQELEITLNAVENSLRVYKKALESDINKYLVGPAVKPVFRKYN
jgi:glutamate-1-semialdehyde 2,1-aminomutase